MNQLIGLYRYGPESNALFNCKIREKARIKLDNEIDIKRNIYTHYVSNNSPVYCRYNNLVYQVHVHNYREIDEYFTLSQYTMGTTKKVHKTC